MKANTVETIIEDFRGGQNIFRRPSVELLVREVSRQAERIAELEEKLLDAEKKTCWMSPKEE